MSMFFQFKPRTDSLLQKKAIMWKVISILLMGTLAGFAKVPKTEVVTLKLLEAIAPKPIKENTSKDKKKDDKDEFELVHSNLGELLKEPQNKGLENVKVIGKKRRLQTETKNYTVIHWEEVGLEGNPSGEDQPTADKMAVKEPIEIPLKTSFVQNSRVIEKDTPIEAKGDKDSLLAAARTLVIKAERQGIQGEALKIPAQTEVPSSQKDVSLSSQNSHSQPNSQGTQSSPSESSFAQQQQGVEQGHSGMSGQSTGYSQSSSPSSYSSSSSAPTSSERSGRGMGYTGIGRFGDRSSLYGQNNPYQVAEKEKREAAEREKREAELRAAQSQNNQQPQIVVNTGNNPAQQGQRGGQEEQGNPAAQNGREGNSDQARNSDRNAPQNPATQNGRGNNSSSPAKPRLPIDPANPQARRALGDLYTTGGIVNKDSARASKMYTKASDAGDIPSFVALGDLAASQNKTKDAVNYYRKAAGKNDPEALLKLAALLERSGSAKDKGEVASLRKRATQALQARQRENAQIAKGLSPEILHQMTEKAAANNPDAQRAAGIALLNGIGVKKDENQGLELLKRAANQGDTIAMNRLADYLKDKDAKQAFEYRRRAAKKEEGRRASHLTPLDQFIANLEAEHRYNQALGSSSLSAETSDRKKVEEEANKGHPVALRKLGEMYAEGVLAPKNSAMALDLFKRAAEKGDNQSLVNLGDMAFKDNNIADAVNYYRQAALKNNPAAQIKLASVLENHPRSPADQKEAQALRKSAAENEKKVEQALKTSLEITPTVVQELMIQAKSGNKRAQTALAILNAKGQGVEENKQKAIDYLEEAAKQGDVHAQLLLSNAYKKGKGVAHDSKTAVDLLEQASQSPSIPGEGTIPEQAKEARETLRHYKKALEEADTRKRERDAEGRPADLEGKADQGDAVAQRKLANHYSQQKKHEKAAEWNTRAAEQNDAAAQVALGDAYMKGEGVTFNPSTALDLYSKAAAQDDPEAQLKLSQLLDGGIGCPRDAKAAEKWRQRAAETANKKREVLNSRPEMTEEAYKDMVENALADHPGAQTSLGILTSKKAEGNKDDNQREGLEWLREAASQGDIKAQTLLANALEKGKGADRDVPEAVRLLKQAAKNEEGLPHRPATETEQDKDNRESLRRYQKALAVLEKRAEKGKGRVFVDSDDEGYESDNRSESDDDRDDEDLSFASSASSSSPINISSSSSSSSGFKPEENDDGGENPWAQFRWGKSLGMEPMEGYGKLDDDESTKVDLNAPDQDFDETKIPKPAQIKIELDLKNSLFETDWTQNKVKQLAKTITYRDGVKVSTSDTYSVVKSFEIQKDYTHPDCEDLIESNIEEKAGEEGLGFAYAMYRPYWINENKERIYLNDHPEKDTKHPMALREEEDKCQYALDLKGMKAISQSGIIYINRSGQRVVYQGCHKTASSKTVPITITQQGCKPLHDLKKGVSYRRQRFVYTVDGVQHEALECHCLLNDKGIEHQFKEGEPLVEKASNLYQPTAQRYVVFVNSNGEQEKIKLSGYEPVGKKAPLKFDEAVCQISPHEDGYHHDMERGHSYVLGRWYYDGLKGKNYVSPSCVKRDKAYPHKQLTTGYKHEDANKRSYPITSLAIEPTPGKAIAIKGKDQIIDYSHPQPYTKVEERSGESTDKEWFDACYKTIRTKQKAIYKRIDNSDYEEALPDKVQKSPEDLCTYPIQTVGYEHAGMSWWKEKGKEFVFYEGLTAARMKSLITNGEWGPDSGYVWEAEKVLVDEYTQYPISPFHPKGKRELKNSRIWKNEYQDKKPQAMSGKSSPPYQTKTWKSGERKVDLRFK